MIYILLSSFFILAYAQDKYLDLGYGYDEKTLAVPIPGLKKFRFTEKFKVKDGGMYMAYNNFEVGEHAGTHIDAPYHFNPDGVKLGHIPVERFFGNGVYINATDETAGDMNYRLPASKFTDWETKNGAMPEKSVIFVDFGWGDRYPNFKEYFGKGFDFPGLSSEAVDWIANSQNVIGLAVDTASPDPGPPFDAHNKLLKKNIFLIENADLNSDQIPALFKVIILPIKLMDGTGGPVRIIAKF